MISVGINIMEYMESNPIEIVNDLLLAMKGI